MAYYLSREFKDRKDVLVINGIRIESDNDAAQIDHLIIHPFGMIVIESKSVFGTIEINEHGEWHRKGSSQGMPSPIEQAKRQAIFLKKCLVNSGLKPPRDFFKSVFRNNTFDKVTVDILIAISDTGNIKRSRKNNTDAIYKADMVPNKVNQIIEDYRTREINVLVFDIKPIPVRLGVEERSAIAEFLVSNHIPLLVKETTNIPPSPTLAAVSVTSPVSIKAICQECGSPDIHILYKYTYYFNCKKCGKNMPITKDNCAKCGQPFKLHKDGNQFYQECKSCGFSKLFFTNVS
jgi:hypothetical protein